MALMLGLVADAYAQGGKTTACGADVALNVTVSGTRTAPGGYGLVSDGLGTYQNAARGAKVSAVFQVANCTQDLIVNLNQSTRKMWALLSGGSRARSSIRARSMNCCPIGGPAIARWPKPR